MSTRLRGARAWLNCDGDYLGVRGVDSLVEMAVVVAADAEICDHLDVEPTVVAVLAWLNRVEVEPVIVPIAHFVLERWDGSQVYPCAIGARPGTGRVKVLGVHL